jgi:hypothetical protein
MIITKEKKYGVDEVLSKVLPYNKIDNYETFDDDIIKMESQRYRLFKRDGVTCVCCGNDGKFFRKEKNLDKDRFHFNLYGYDKKGNEVLYTKDHIYPKSKGGKNTLTNYQVMCSPCNHEKGNKYDLE